MENSQRLKLSIIILSWNTKELLRQCLRSLISNFQPPIFNYEIIVVDNGSIDGSPRMVKKDFSQVKLIANRTNLGFARGNNQALRQAQGRYVMLLNSDTIVRKGALGKLVDFLNKNPEVGAVSPLVLNEDGSIQKDPCYLRFPSLLLALFYYNRVLKRLALTFFPQILFSATKFEKPTEVDQLPGAALVVRKSVLDEIGGFDEDYQLYFEDTDLCWRIKSKDYKLMVVPEAKIIHLGRKSIEPVIKKEGMERFYSLNFNSLFLFCRKHYPLRKSTLIRAIIILHLASTFKLRLVLKLVRNSWP